MIVLEFEIDSCVKDAKSLNKYRKADHSREKEKTYNGTQFDD